MDKRIPVQPLSKLPTKLPLPNLGRKPVVPVPVRPTYYLRRSKSACDINSLKKIGNNKENVTKPAAKTATFLKPAVTQRTGVKRAAPTKPELKEPPKIQKQERPAPYDYKARFNQLKEIHIKLKEETKETRQKLTETLGKLEQLEDKDTKYKDLSKKHEDLLQSSDELKNKCDDLRNKNGFLTKELNEYQETLEARVICFKQLQEKYDSLYKQQEKAEFDITSLKEDNQRKDRLIEYLKIRLTNAEVTRKMLHNDIQDLKGNIRVFSRVRPPNEDETNEMQCLVNYFDEARFEIQKNAQSFSNISGKLKDVKEEFNFDHVFSHASTQEEIFQELAPLVQSALDGYHVCVFAYGQTGSGKTYTMQGEDFSSEKMGIIPRSCDLMFAIIGDMKLLGWQHKVEASILEIYNENVKDLLNPNSNQQHSIRYNCKHFNF